jgi:hypothetical protein
MTTLNVIELILAVTIIGLAGIALAAVASLLVQSASATDVKPIWIDSYSPTIIF